MRHVALLAGICGTLWSPRAEADDVVAFGDEWAASSTVGLAPALAAAGFPAFTVFSAGVAGTTAADWAVGQPDALSDAVTLNPDAQWVWLSVGGNDLYGLHFIGQGGQTAAANDQNIRSLLDRLFLDHPNVRVVMFGYDYSNFVQSAECGSEGASLFGSGVTQQDINQYFLNEVGNVLASIDADYDNFKYVPIWGALQLDAGLPGAPDFTQPSPATSMRDCRQPNAQGHRVDADALVAAYWDVPAPNVSITPTLTTACVGDTQVYTSITTNTAERRWRVNGADRGTGGSVSVTFAAAGTTTITLKGFNQAYVDTDTQNVVVSTCVDAGFPDSGFESDAAPDSGFDAGFDAGFPDSGFDAGFPDSGFDGGTPDTGFDSGEEPDAADLDGGEDAGDAGVEPDTGPDAMPMDAQADSGVDGGFPDSGVADDTGARDTGPGPDDSGIPDAAETWTLSGGCRAVELGASGRDGLWPLLCFGLVLALRRRVRAA